MKKSELIFTAILVPVDFLMLLTAGIFSYYLRISPTIVEYRPVLFYLNLPFSRFLTLVLGVSFFMLLVFVLVGLYRIEARRSLWSDFVKILIGVSAGIMILVFYVFLQQELFNSRFLVLAGWFLAIIFVFLGRLVMILSQRYFIKNYQIGAHKVALIGGDNFSASVRRQIEQEPSLGYQITGIFDRPDFEKFNQMIKEGSLDEVILAEPNLSKDDFLSLLGFCDDEHIVFKFVPNFFQSLTSNSSVATLGTVPVVEIKRTALDGWGRIIKRVFDFIGALLFIAFFSWLFLLIALFIKIDSPGPVLYRDYRYGYKKKKFVFYKFRTMRADLCDGEFGTKAGNQMLKELEKDQSKNMRQDGPLHKIVDDPRITKVGKFLRKYSLDELPQFFNVLKGDMSLVGYRPHMSYEVEKYTRQQAKMFVGKPGITGLAQISGRSDLNFDEEVKLDLFYIENWSLILDLIILFKTPFMVLFKRHRV